MSGKHDRELTRLGEVLDRRRDEIIALEQASAGPPRLG
jgi:hypothetical protein